MKQKLYPAMTWQNRHPEEHRRIVRRRQSAQVYTNKTPGGRSLRVPAPHKRNRPEECELCGCKPRPAGMNWHHWNRLNPSVGLWICWPCDQLGEAVDTHGAGFGEKYIHRKLFLDKLYADGELVRLAKAAGARRHVNRTIDGVSISFAAWGKRDRPRGNLCELCGVGRCCSYHHWDNRVRGKGLWVCGRCHFFAGRIDTYGIALVEKYLLLKEKDEVRVSGLTSTECLIASSNMPLV